MATKTEREDDGATVVLHRPYNQQTNAYVPLVAEWRAFFDHQVSKILQADVEDLSGHHWQLLCGLQHFLCEESLLVATTGGLV